MSPLNANAFLRRRILLHLLKGPVPSLTALASALEAPRPSVSRAVQALKADGLVERTGRRWCLTATGKEKAEAVAREAQGRAGETLSLAREAMDRQQKILRELEATGTRRIMDDFQRLIHQQRALLNQVMPRFSMDAIHQAFALQQSTAVQEALRQLQSVPALPIPDTSKWLSDHQRQILQQFHRTNVEQLRIAVESLHQTFGARDELERTLTRVTELVQAAQPALAAWRSEFAVLSVPRLSDLIPESLRRWLGKITREARAQEAFEGAGLVLAPSMGDELIESVAEVQDRGGDPAEVEQLVLDYYDADDCRRLERLIDGLCERPEFTGWEKRLRQALAAHRMGWDELPAPVLVPIIEGVLAPYLRKPNEGDRWVKHGEIPQRLEGDGKLAVVAAVGFTSYFTLLTFLKEHLYYSYQWSLDPDATTTAGRLNRHDLVHGRHKSSCRVHTVRCFATLDVIAALLAVNEGLIAGDAEDSGQVAE